MQQPDNELAQRRAELRRSSRLIDGSEHEPDHVELARVAAWCETHGIEADSYGEGEGLQAFEARVADMLGYPAARFMPSGTMAQQIAVRVWSERSGIGRFAMHPTCHLELHEQHGYRRLHGLDAVLVGDAGRPLSAEDLHAVSGTVSALIIELPTRENGGQLAPWDDLLALCETAKQQGIAVHLDGARLWEAAAGYDKPLDEICELFDSTYVSFYKGIGALPGSMLAGEQDFVDEAAVWQRRHGGNLYNSMANWVSADMRLDGQIAAMPSYRDRAIEIAAVLSGIDGIAINPAVPQVNMFHVFLDGAEDDLVSARDRVAESRGLWLFGGLQSTDVPHVCKFELAISDAAGAVDNEEIAAAFNQLLGH